MHWAWNFLKIAQNLNWISGVEFKPAWRNLPKQNLNYSAATFWVCPLQDFIYFFKIKQTIKLKKMKKNSKLCLNLKSFLVDSPKTSSIETREKRFDKKCWDLLGFDRRIKLWEIQLCWEMLARNRHQRRPWRDHVVNRVRTYLILIMT